MEMFNAELVTNLVIVVMGGFSAWVAYMECQAGRNWFKVKIKARS